MLKTDILMATEKPLYEDVDLKITYLLDSKGEVIDVTQHELFISSSKTRYALSTGVLKKLSESSRKGLSKILEDVSPDILKDLKEQRLTTDAIGFVANLALKESEKRFEEYMSKNY